MKAPITLLVALSAMSCTATPAAPPATSVELLLDTDRTILEQALAYPAGHTRVTAARMIVPNSIAME